MARTAKNSKKAVVGVPFKAGQSGNPVGRAKGVPNKTTALLKDAILQAATAAGGEATKDSPGGLVAYLKAQADANPGPFMALLGKVLPMQVGGDPDNPIVHEIHIRVVDPRS